MLSWRKANPNKNYRNTLQVREDDEQGEEEMC